MWWSCPPPFVNHVLSKNVSTSESNEKKTVIISQDDIETQKDDIERRRQEELLELTQKAICDSDGDVYDATVTEEDVQTVKNAILNSEIKTPQRVVNKITEESIFKIVEVLNRLNRTREINNSQAVWEIEKILDEHLFNASNVAKFIDENLDIGNNYKGNINEINSKYDKELLVLEWKNYEDIKTWSWKDGWTSAEMQDKNVESIIIIDKDPHFEDAARLIVEKQQVSVALIQTTYCLGQKAAKVIIEQLEQAGIVWPVVNGKRDLLIKDMRDLEEVLEEILEKKIDSPREWWKNDIYISKPDSVTVTEEQLLGWDPEDEKKVLEKLIALSKNELEEEVKKSRSIIDKAVEWGMKESFATRLRQMMDAFPWVDSIRTLKDDMYQMQQELNKIVNTDDLSSFWARFQTLKKASYSMSKFIGNSFVEANIAFINEDSPHGKEFANYIVASYRIWSAISDRIGGLSLDVSKEYVEKRKELEWNGVKTDKTGTSVSEVTEKEHHTKMYADTIIDDKFWKVTEVPNKDTIFELLLENSSATTAKVTVAESAYRRILANPSYLEWTTKQVLNGATKVIIKEMGEAQKWFDGKRTITKKPEIRLVSDDW